MKDELRTHAMPLAVEERAAEGGKKRVLVGYAAVFGKRSVDLGGFTEEIAPGAFRNTIQADEVVALVDHDSRLVIGRRSAGTLRLSEDETGLRMEVDLPDTTVGRDIEESTRRGDVAGASFKFRTVSDEWRVQDEMPHRTLLEVKLVDVGPTAFPAYPDTSVAMRSLERHRSEEAPRVADLSVYDRKHRLAESFGR